MSENDEQPKPTETEQFARMFAEFMRTSMAHTQNQIIPPESPHKPESQRIDSSPLVIGERLNGENYSTWAILMKAAISGRGLISHITGVPTPPARTDQTFERWQQADHCVFTWLIQNVEQKLVSRLTQYPTAKEIWTSLEVTYASGGDKIQVYDLYAKAITLKQKEESLEDIWTTLNDLWISIDRRQPNRMKYAEDIEIYHTEKQEQRLFQLLVALNGKYENIKKEILRVEPLPSVENAYAMLRREDTRSAVLQAGDSSTQGIGAGLAVTHPWQNPAAHRNSSQRSGGGNGGNWSKRPDEDKSKLVCSHCGKKKHTRETCFELHGYPEWWQERKAKNNPSPAPFRGGRAAAAVAGGEETPAAAVGSNSVANRGSGGQGTEGIAVGIASVARGGGGGALPERREFFDVEAPNVGDVGGGKLGFENLFSNPPFFELYQFKPYTKKTPKIRPPDIDKFQRDPRNENKPQTDSQNHENPKSAPLICENRFQVLENLPTAYALSVSSENKMINGFLIAELLTPLLTISLIYLICIGHRKVIFKLQVENLRL